MREREEGKRHASPDLPVAPLLPSPQLTHSCFFLSPPREQHLHRHLGQRRARAPAVDHAGGGRVLQGGEGVVKNGTTRSKGEREARLRETGVLFFLPSLFISPSVKTHAHRHTPWPGAASCPKTCRSCGACMGERRKRRDCASLLHTDRRAAPFSSLASPTAAPTKTQHPPVPDLASQPGDPVRGRAGWGRGGPAEGERERETKGDGDRAPPALTACACAPHTARRAPWRLARAHQESRFAAHPGHVTVCEARACLQARSGPLAHTTNNAPLYARSCPNLLGSLPPLPPSPLSPATSSPPSLRPSSRPTRASPCWCGRRTAPPPSRTPATTRAPRRPSPWPALTRQAWRPRSGGSSPRGRPCPGARRARGRCPPSETRERGGGGERGRERVGVWV